jgi:hypothetical protein
MLLSIPKTMTEENSRTIFCVLSLFERQNVLIFCPYRTECDGTRNLRRRPHVSRTHCDLTIAVHRTGGSWMYTRAKQMDPGSFEGIPDPSALQKIPLGLLADLPRIFLQGAATFLDLGLRL